MEFAVNSLNLPDKVGMVSVSSNYARVNNELLATIQDYPGEYVIKHLPDKKDNMLYIWIPQHWLRIHVCPHIPLTGEALEKKQESIRLARQKRLRNLSNKETEGD